MRRSRSRISVQRIALSTASPSRSRPLRRWGWRPIATTSRTVNANWSTVSCGITARSRAHSSCPSFPSGRPSSSTEPRVGSSSPERRRRSVDLPAPFGPVRASTSPAASSRSTPSTSFLPPISNVRSVPRTTTLIAAQPSRGHVSSARAARGRRARRERRDHAERKLDRRGRGPRDDVGEDDEGGAAERAAGEHDCVGRPGREPHQVGDDEADEGDHARHRNGRSCRKRDREHEDQPAALGVDAEVRGLALPERHQVELARSQAHDGDADRDARRRRADDGPGRTAEAAHRPEDDVAQLGVVGPCDQEPDRGAHDRRHGDAGQDQRHRLGSALVAGEPVDGERGDDAAGEGSTAASRPARLR